MGESFVMKGLREVITFLSLFMFISFFGHVHATQKKAAWTIVIFIQACNNLESFAHKNLKDMIKVGTKSGINILVELHKPGEQSWRYKIERDSYNTEQVLSRASYPNIGNELVSTMQWAVNAYPANKYGLILWNHGSGVIDPQFNTLQPYYMKNSPTKTTLSRSTRNKLPRDRGILFDDERQTYLNNKDLRTAIQTISTNILKGKKIDLVGMDACLMGMVEVAYQLKNHVQYFVSSQEFEFAQGWAYADLLNRLTQKTFNGEELSHNIVETYRNYYRSRTHYYTQSSVFIDHVQLLVDNINRVAETLLACKQQDPKGIGAIIQRARHQCLSFSVPDYIDLHSFFYELHNLLINAQDKTFSPPNTPARRLQYIGNLSKPKVESSLIEHLKTQLTLGMQLVKRVVIANTTGRYLNRAQGISIYFPQKAIDESYMKTEFAKDCHWVDLVHDHLMNEQHLPK